MAKTQTNNAVASNIYTALLGAAVLAVIATSVYVAMKCMQEYGAIFTIVK